MLLTSFLHSVAAFNPNKAYKLIASSNSSLRLSMGSNGKVTMGSHVGKVTWKTADKGRFYMFVDGAQVCRNGDKLKKCDDGSSKIEPSSQTFFLDKVKDGVFKIRWGVVGSAKKFIALGNKCLTVDLKDKKVDMDRCSDSKATQQFVFEPISEGSLAGEFEYEGEFSSREEVDEREREFEEEEPKEEKKPDCQEYCKNKNTGQGGQKPNCAEVCNKKDKPLNVIPPQANNNKNCGEACKNSQTPSQNPVPIVIRRTVHEKKLPPPLATGGTMYELGNVYTGCTPNQRPASSCLK